MNRAEKARLQLRAVGVLRTLKQGRTYDELSDLTELPPGDLNRYVNGHVLPGPDRARSLLAAVGRDRVVEEFRRRVTVDEEGYVDTSGAVFDLPFLSLVVPVAAESMAVGSADAVLTAATDGITTAAAFADYFDARSVYAKKTKETGVEEFVESRQRLQSGIELTYYLPAEALEPGQRVLVVDDLIRSGETQTLLLDIADRVGAEVVGVFSLVAVGEDGIERARDHTEAPVEALVEF